MVADHLAAINNECPVMVQQELHQDLRNAFALLKSIKDGLSVLVQQVQEHIKQQGLKAVGNITGDNVASQFVESLLGVYTKYKEMTVSVFSSNQQFCSALDIACAAVVNHRSHPKQPCKSPELLAKYCDSLLKKSTKGTDESEVDEKLSHCITFFKYVDDKDVYQKFYSSLLEKRLIYQLSHSMDAEELMINRLKQACGYEFTNKLLRMLTDMSVSSDLNTKFSNTLNDKHELGLNFSIKVLQSGAWPLGQSFQAVDFAVPQELERSVQRFEDFYRTQFNGRKLLWVHLMSTCELKVNCMKKPYIITMQAQQMALLLKFEKTNSMTCEELRDTTKLNTVNFQTYLMGLIDSNLLIVSCNPSEIFEPSTVISLNLDFSKKRPKFKLTYTVQKEAVQETKRSHFAVEMDREMFLQATIVRIMKSRKILRHNVLIQEVLSQSKARFSPSNSLIKKCIETLIDKQYLERPPSSTYEYSYVA